MLFAGNEFQEIVLKYYGHITHQKGAWIPEKDSILLAPKELAYIDLCVSATPLGFHFLCVHEDSLAAREENAGLAMC